MRQFKHAALGRMKPCLVCKHPFEPARPLQRACSPECAIQHAKAKAATAERKAQAADRRATKAKLDALRTKPQLVKLAQQAFNSYIRARDAGKPCISCGKPLGTQPNTYDCGHYRSIGSAPHLRFAEDNAHGQCKYCNNHLSGNHVAYRQGLLERLGESAVELIERDATLRKYTHAGLIELARQYREMARGQRGKNA